MHERPHGLTLTNLVCFDGTLAELLGVTTQAPTNEHTAGDLAGHESGRGRQLQIEHSGTVQRPRSDGLPLAKVREQVTAHESSGCGTMSYPQGGHA